MTEAHVAAAKRWSTTHGIALDSLDVVGFHGQTITHRPERRFTWQIGDGAGLARALGVRVVNDLRGADVAAGGQGAPLVPVFHAALVRDLPRPIAVVNIGGVANVTWIGADDELLAFDTGPGNGLIDDWCSAARRPALRRDGALAAAGKVDRTRLERWVEHPTSRASRPSRSTAATSTTLGRRSVGGGRRGDADACARRARSPWRRAISRQPATQWIVTGGGARNPTLLAAIAAETGTPVVPARRPAGTAMRWRRRPSPSSRCARCAACRSAFPATTGAPGR